MRHPLDGPRPPRLVETALRCYPARWQRRHGDEAAELAALLIRDGTSTASIARSYLAGAAREWLMPRPGRPLTAVAGALLAAVCLFGVSAGLLASAGPARAASTSHTHGPVLCHSSVRPLVPRVAPAHPPLIIPGAGRARSC